MPITVAVRALRALGDNEPNSVARQNDHRALPGIADGTPRRGRSGSNIRAIHRGAAVPRLAPDAAAPAPHRNCPNSALGFVTATSTSTHWGPKLARASCRCDSAVPLCGGFGSEDPQCGSGHEVALKVEGFVNGGVHAEETLGGSSRLEPLQLAFASSHYLMRIFRAIVAPEPLLVRAAES